MLFHHTCGGEGAGKVSETCGVLCCDVRFVKVPTVKLRHLGVETLLIFQQGSVQIPLFIGRQFFGGGR